MACRRATRSRCSSFQRRCAPRPLERKRPGRKSTSRPTSSESTSRASCSSDKEKEVEENIARVEKALDELRRGHMVILVDDAERENEGDLVLAAQFVTPQAINFMAKHARGLICLSLTEEQVKRLGLTMMVSENQS